MSEQLAALATAYVLLMAIIGPVTARVVEPLARRALPRRAASATKPEPQAEEAVTSASGPAERSGR